MKKVHIKNLTDIQLSDYFISISEKKFRAKQLLDAIYKQNICNFDEILNFPIQLRVALNDEFDLYSIQLDKISISKDGSKKLLFQTNDACFIESVYLPNAATQNAKKKQTICISTMIGCPLNCVFCATARLGYKRNLSCSEIIDQILLTQKTLDIKIDNVVIMGMGEPLMNYNNALSAVEIMVSQKLISHKSITLSTVGIPEKIALLADSGANIKLAWSLHSPIDNIRQTLMPTAAVHKIETICKALDYYYKKTKLPITIEYVLLKNINNSADDIKRLTRIAHRFPSCVNIIPFNDISFADSENILIAANNNEIEDFANKLRANKVVAIVRKSQGADIEAACGQLAYNQ